MKFYTDPRDARRTKLMWLTLEPLGYHKLAFEYLHTTDFSNHRLVHHFRHHLTRKVITTTVDGCNHCN